MTKEQLSAVIGHNIRRLRRAEGFTQAELAEMVDRDASTVTNIEGGKRLIGVDLLYRLAEVFSVSVDTLLQPKENQPPWHPSIVCWAVNPMRHLPIWSRLSGHGWPNMAIPSRLREENDRFQDKEKGWKQR